MVKTFYGSNTVGSVGSVGIGGMEWKDFVKAIKEKFFRASDLLSVSVSVSVSVAVARSRSSSPTPPLSLRSWARR